MSGWSSSSLSTATSLWPPSPESELFKFWGVWVAFEISAVSSFLWLIALEWLMLRAPNTCSSFSVIIFRKWFRSFAAIYKKGEKACELARIAKSRLHLRIDIHHSCFQKFCRSLAWCHHLLPVFQNTPHRNFAVAYCTLPNSFDPFDLLVRMCV